MEPAATYDAASAYARVKLWLQRDVAVWFRPRSLVRAPGGNDNPSYSNEGEADLPAASPRVPPTEWDDDSVVSLPLRNDSQGPLFPPVRCTDYSYENCVFQADRSVSGASSYRTEETFLNSDAPNRTWDSDPSTPPVAKAVPQSRLSSSPACSQGAFGALDADSTAAAPESAARAPPRGGGDPVAASVSPAPRWSLGGAVGSCFYQQCLPSFLRGFWLRRHDGWSSKERDLFGQYSSSSSKGHRTVYVQQNVPPSEGQPESRPKFCQNKIKTSRYTLLNFVPRNLFEQFRRIANFYFLLVVVIMLSIESPVTPVTSILPLLFVIGVTAIKQGYEDWNRHCEDDKANNTPAFILKNAQLLEFRSRDICVGDIVKVSSDEQFPCDLLLLTSSNAEGRCDVTTANLDGETNLKTFHCPSTTRHLADWSELASVGGVVDCQHPNPDLYEFKGRARIHTADGRVCHEPLSARNLLLRGARLKNTDFVYGCAIYTGEDTKISLNSKFTRHKFSTVEATLNYYLLTYLFILLCEIIISTLIKNLLYSDDRLSSLWYLCIERTGRGVHFFQDFFSFMVLYNWIIPISIYVTLEMQRICSVLFFEWDKELRYEKTGEYAKCNTSDLNEELGQVQYIFTDKTGTLTENSMRFRMCSVNGVVYVDTGGVLKRETVFCGYDGRPLDVKLREFFITVALCHTVQVVSRLPSRGGLEYQASSPDEKALVEAAATYGIMYLGTKNGRILLQMDNGIHAFEPLELLEFDSGRKCMSVIVRDMKTGKISLLVKGAECSILRKCRQDTALIEITQQHIDNFAMLGLRTLVIAKRELTEAEYSLIARRLSEAQQVIANREEAVAQIYKEIECGLTLLGATGVEDLLQDGVQETLECLRIAGIKIWILTGDKVETAVNIAYSCGHFKRFMTILSLTGIPDVAMASLRLQECRMEMQSRCNFGMVTDGSSLSLMLGELRHQFYEICSACTAVVCCRMSPKQKSEVVRLVKFSPARPKCAAIGDGANDVAMIQEANIGFGIMGKEGRQAVRCSDFAFGRFRFLRKVLLVHGHWYYVRVSTLVQYSFYKNIVFVTPQLLFALSNAFSAQTVYDSFFLMLYNLVFTSLPIFIYGLFEQNIPAAVLLKCPRLYRDIAKNKRLATDQFFKWTLLGVWHSCVLYFGLARSLDEMAWIDGRTSDLTTFGTTLVTACIMLVTTKLLIETHHYSVLFVASIFITFLAFSIPTLIFVYFLDFFSSSGSLPVMNHVQKYPCILLTLLVLIVTCLIVDFVLILFKDPRTQVAH